MGYIYGTDGSSSSACNGTPTFYIGEIGNYAGLNSGVGNCNGSSGPCPGDGGCCFNTTAASDANQHYGTWGYYFIGGPTADPAWDPSTYTEADAYSWGEKQGNATINYWLGTGFNNASYVGRTTIFADIEDPTTDYGWLVTSDTYNGVSGEKLNHEVFDGWYNTVNGHSTAYGTLHGGVYSSPSAWSDAMGTKSLAGVPVWTYEVDVGGCGCPTSMSNAEDFGSGNLVFYQYSQSCGDLDMADTTNLPS